MKNFIDRSRRPVLLAVVAMLGGTIAAASGILSTAERRVPLPESVVARVDGRSILRADYERLLAGLARDRRGGLDEEQRRHVLDRLIEEGGLLVQRGLELGLASHDSRVRKDLTAAMIDSVVAEYRDLKVDDADLRAFYEDNRDLFRRADRMRVQQIWISAPTLAEADAAHARATEAVRALRSGVSFESVRERYADPAMAPIPNALLPPAKLADYLGGTAVRALLSLRPGGITEPIRSNSGFHVLRLVERASEESASFDELRHQVLAAYRREAADEALRDYLEELRARANVELGPDAP